MTALFALFFFLTAALLAGSGLFAQYRAQEHQKEMGYGATRIAEIEQRLSDLERKRTEAFDPKAFEDLQTKVEALRLAQGLRR